MAFSPSPSVSLVLVTRIQAQQALGAGWLHTLGHELIVTQDTRALLQALLAAADPGDEVLLQLAPTYDALRCGELRRGEGKAPLPLQWAWVQPLVRLVQAGERALSDGLV